MSVFTVIILIWAIYQIATSLTKKRSQLYTGRLSDPLKQIQQTWKRGPFPLRNPLSMRRDYGERYDDYGSEEGNEDTGGFEEIPSQLAEGNPEIQEQANDAVELERAMEQTPSERYSGRDNGRCDDGSFPSTDWDVRQGIIWAEILGQPRALKPFGKR